jgi:hypothetical protein
MTKQWNRIPQNLSGQDNNMSRCWRTQVSTTGQDKIVECVECKVSVNMKDFDEITLNERRSNCKIAERLRDVKSLENVKSNQNGSNERKRKSTFCTEVNGLLENSNLDSTKLGDQTISPTQNPLTQNSTSLRQPVLMIEGKIHL